LVNETGGGFLTGASNVQHIGAFRQVTPENADI
jgi:hypothetical protein